ncbi:winged helix DNA-binding domain-containing protein [Rhodoferax sp.]|uniref:winged helix DNA-binding domain-containing protein n=1 Tax=Rhodoferax sp. TaxID=50421 RepID=UPI0028499311|nr:winged helix DNA-binding domain-containing protein [Rhodoferax sp.]MDR3371105.1 winged helix DNA-binding domain-containing protein [Rhodoferax sp.]
MNIPALRLHHQHIALPHLKRPEQVVAWLGGLQGQDYPGAKWSIALRLPHATEADVAQAFDAGKIVRSWPMRGTLHVVAAEDLRWMLMLTSPKNIAISASRRRALELDDATLARCREVFTQALQGGKQLSREGMYAALAQSHISTEGSRGYHILWNCALHGLICLAATNDKDQNFALVEEWLPPTPPKTRDEALAELAARYFLSRGPATLQDFIWWSGLSATEARSGNAAIQSQLVKDTANGLSYWMPAESRLPKDAPSAFALPGFDEYLLGYKDRSAVLDAAHAEQVCPGGNGVFAATIVIDGRVVGTWKRVFKKAGIEITASPFKAMRPEDMQRFSDAVQRYGAFYQLPVRVVL